MRLLWSIIVLFFVLAIGMFGYWTLVLRHGAEILEFDYPSFNIAHSIEKGIFIDTLEILNTDTIRTDYYERVDLIPVSCWVEKMTYWKSGTMSLDSVGFSSDTVVLVVNFKNFINGDPWAPFNSGYFIVDFQDEYGNLESVYIDDDMTQLTLNFSIDQLNDTIRLISENDEQILLGKRTN